MEGYDMQNATVFMECGGSGYPYYQCIGIEDFSCPSEKPTPTPVPNSGLKDRRVGENAMGVLFLGVLLLSFIRRHL
jgi:hypothetical protein